MKKSDKINIIKSAILKGEHPEPPEPDRFKPTGVMVLILPEPEIKLLFILKADLAGYPWANQMAFPGGHKDKNDKTTKNTGYNPHKYSSEEKVCHPFG